jgi:hypothetical protein
MGRWTVLTHFLYSLCIADAFDDLLVFCSSQAFSQSQDAGTTAEDVLEPSERATDTSVTAAPSKQSNTSTTTTTTSISNQPTPSDSPEPMVDDCIVSDTQAELLDCIPGKRCGCQHVVRIETSRSSMRTDLLICNAIVQHGSATSSPMLAHRSCSVPTKTLIPYVDSTSMPCHTHWAY